MTAQISLRPLRVDDADEMARVLAAPALYTFTGGEPPTAELLAEQYGFQVRGWSPDRSERWINDLIVLDSTGEAVGYVQATVPQDGGPAEVAWVVGAPWQGRGFATTAVRLLLARLAGLGVGGVIAHIHPDHAASNAVARRCGMRPTDQVVDGEVRWEGPVAGDG